jgi:ABC-type Fe3+-hydroxamate transport system substrate-binding protein
MAVFTDNLGRSISIPAPPKRIVSLVPSQTELLYHLGLHKEVVGITKFCIHPAEWAKTKTRIGGTKNVAIEKIKSLQPDLIIANKEENVEAQVEELAKDFPVWVSDVNNLDEALQLIQSIGNITYKAEKAASIVQNIQKGFETFLPHTFSNSCVPYLATTLHDYWWRYFYQQSFTVCRLQQFVSTEPTLSANNKRRTAKCTARISISFFRALPF